MDTAVHELTLVHADRKLLASPVEAKLYPASGHLRAVEKLPGDQKRLLAACRAGKRRTSMCWVRTNMPAGPRIIAGIVELEAPASLMPPVYHAGKQSANNVLGSEQSLLLAPASPLKSWVGTFSPSCFERVPTSETSALARPGFAGRRICFPVHGPWRTGRASHSTRRFYSCARRRALDETPCASPRGALRPFS